MTRLLANVWRKSCHLKFVISALLKTPSHEVLMSWKGWPSESQNTYLLLIPGWSFHARRIDSASAFNGMCLVLLVLLVEATTVRFCCSKSTCSHFNLSS